MTAIALALTAALAWGAADYFGGDTSRRHTPVLVVVALAELLGAGLMAPVLIAHDTPAPDLTRLLPAVAAGLAVTVELALIYRALSRGQAFITAPTGALGSAAAVAVGLIGGDPLTLGLAVGLACALAGSAVSTWSGPSAGERRPAGADALLTCLGAAAAVGVALVELHAAGRADPVWATATEHVSTALSAGLAARLAHRGPLRALTLDRHQLRGLGLVALTGVAGDLAYTAASHGGELSIVSALGSLYPVSTIALGRLLRQQRANRLQLAGIVLALGGAVVLGAATG